MSDPRGRLLTDAELAAESERVRERVMECVKRERLAQHAVVQAAIDYARHYDSPLPGGSEGRRWWHAREMALEWEIARAVRALDAARKEEGDAHATERYYARECP